MNNPMVAQTLQGAVLSATSNILAQAITAYKDGTTFALQLEPIKRFVIFSILSNPPNIVWQDFLEKAFPTAVAASKRPTSEKNPAKTVTSKTNILIKFLLDQSVGAAVNTWMFLAFMAYVNASQQAKVSAWDLILKDCKERTWPMMKDGYKFWPVISLISFMWVPVDKRVVFGCSAGVLWGIYLSLAVDA